MRRRRFMAGAASIASAALAGARALSDQSNPYDPEEAARQRAASLAAARAAFPYKLTEVPSAKAVSEWERRRAPDMAPLLIGDPATLERLLDPFTPGYFDLQGGPPDLAETLAKADRLRFPEDLQAERDHFLKHSDFAKLHEETRARLAADGVPSRALFDPPRGAWPADPDVNRAYRPSIDFETRQPIPMVGMLLIPTRDWTTIPAHLRWGGWNFNPAPEHHVAALRAWRDRYGAELVELQGAFMQLRVARRPKSRAAALALAREHYLLCNDIVDQGFFGLAPLAAALMESDWWWFWWD